ncbi:integral membrane protein Pth11-like protein [Aspergillus crustosus]
MAIGFGEPPPGIDLSESTKTRNNGVAISLTILATIAVILRVVARLKTQKVNFSTDDWLVVVSLIPTYGSMACTVLGGEYGLGKHVWAVSTDNLTRLNQIHFAYILIYFWTNPLIKLSLIFFYRRIFGTKPIMYVCGFLTLAYFFGCTIAFVACCRPPSYHWTQYTDPSSGHCVFNLYPFYIANGAANVATDLLILVVPIPLVLGLQMRLVQKLLVLGIFMLGIVVCVASVIRIYYLIPLYHDLDTTWIQANIYVWSTVEPCVGILCACLPTLQPLVRLCIKKILGSSATHGRWGNSTSKGVSSGAKHLGSRSRSKGGTLDEGSAVRGWDTDRRRKSRTGFGQFDESGLRVYGDGDEALLTTATAEGHEMDDLGRSRDGRESGSEEGIMVDAKGMGIQVKTDFRWREHHK